jgi:hypothetical protein
MAKMRQVFGLTRLCERPEISAGARVVLLEPGCASKYLIWGLFIPLF